MPIVGEGVAMREALQGQDADNERIVLDLLNRLSAMAVSRSASLQPTLASLSASSTHI